MPPAQPRGLLPGDVIDYVEVSSDLIVTAASAAAAQSFITGNSIIYDGATRIRIEFFCPFQNAASGNELIANIWEDSTDLNRVGIFDNDGPVYAAIVRTPSAGPHTYAAKVWKGSGSGRQFSCGASSASGPCANAHLTVRRF